MMGARKAAGVRMKGCLWRVIVVDAGPKQKQFGWADFIHSCNR